MYEASHARLTGSPTIAESRCALLAAAPRSRPGAVAYYFDFFVAGGVGAVGLGVAAGFGRFA